MTTQSKRGRPGKGLAKVGGKIIKGSHVSANLGESLAQTLRDKSAETGIPLSEIVRRAIEEYLKKI